MPNVSRSDEVDQRSSVLADAGRRDKTKTVQDNLHDM